MRRSRWAGFLSPDERIELFDSQGLNRYSYVSNQPTSMIDPGGEFALGFGGGFGGIGGMSGMSSFGSIGSTGQLPQAASSQGIMSSGRGWPCGDDVCPGDPPLNLLGTEFAELYKAIAQEEEGSQQPGRAPGQVYVTGHRVGDVGPYHTAVEYDDGTGRPTTLSAEGIDGDLTSDVNRPTDCLLYTSDAADE